LDAIDTYGTIFSCDGGTARDEVARMIMDFNQKPKRQMALIKFFESEGHLAQLTTNRKA
jgi:hypothetical protein